MTMSAKVMLPSKAVFDLLAPDPRAFTHNDVSNRLARVARWCGESHFDVPLSVAQHSLYVVGYLTHHAPHLSNRIMLRALLHDAPEAFFGFDPVGPLKRALGASFAAIEEGIWLAVCERFDLSPTSEFDKLIKQADLTAAASEAEYIVGWTREQAERQLGIVVSADPIDYGAELFGYAPWQPLSSHQAEIIFDFALAEYL